MKDENVLEFDYQMEQISIINNYGFNYLSDVFKANNMNDLPDNVHFNKVTTGCGMTSVVLSNDIPYVVCVPKRNLVKNKVKWCEDRNIKVLGVYGEKDSGVSTDEIIDFDGDKIIVTYDSLPRVTEALKVNGRLKDFKILVDECHELIKAGNYRYKAIDKVLEDYEKYKAFVFGTATPIDNEYQHPKLRSIKKAEICWDNLEPVTINYCRFESPCNCEAKTDENVKCKCNISNPTELYKNTAIIIIKHLTGELKGNAHIFINSVTDIVKIIKIAKDNNELNPNQIRIIVSDNDENDKKLVKGLGKDFKISDINSDSKHINFYTSTAFEGVDIFDEDSVTYIVSDGSKNHSKIDVLITLPQIIGRIRNSKHKNFVNLLYSPNTYWNHSSEESFKQSVIKDLNTMKRKLDRFKSLTDEEDIELELKSFSALAKETNLIYLDDKGYPLLNSTYYAHELQNYRTLHKTYYTSKYAKEKNGVTTIKSNSIDYNYTPGKKEEYKGLHKSVIEKRVSYKDLCEEYHNNGVEDFLLRDKIANLKPSIKEAYEKLGWEKMVALKLRQSDIVEELLTLDKTKSLAFKIANLLGYKEGQWIETKEIEQSLKELYNKFGIRKYVTATQITDFYNATEKVKKIDRKSKRGFVINSLKFKEYTTQKPNDPLNQSYGAMMLSNNNIIIDENIDTIETFDK